MFETTNSSIHGSMYFIETMQFGANEWKYFHSSMKQH